jgi:uncharacterized protein YlxW (UPF0749 family)
MSSYTLRATSYTGEHLDRELRLRGAHTSGSTQRKQQRLQRFVEAENNATERFETRHQQIMERIDNRIQELRRTIVNIPTTTPEVRRSSRISRLLNEYLGY